MPSAWWSRPMAADVAPWLLGRPGTRRQHPVSAPALPGRFGAARTLASEGVARDLAADGHPLLLGESLQVRGRPAMTRPVAGVAKTAERNGRLVVDCLVVDVDKPGRDAVGERQALGDVAGQDAQGEPVIGSRGQ